MSLSPNTLFLACIFFLVASVNASPNDDLLAPDLFFESDIRPILRQYCFECHGANDEKDGNLDLRLVHKLLKGGDSGAGIYPLQADQSLIIKRIEAREMPPNGHAIPEDQVAIVRRWINEGAKTKRTEPDAIESGIPLTIEDREYWAYRPIPSNLQVPPSKKPDSTIGGWLLSGAGASRIDGWHLVGSQVGEADRATLVKRVYFDLVGTAPTLEVIEEAKQSSAPDWYERIVEELLASPSYGERWARHWLDLAGYADSEGMTAQDAERPWAWKYRDYVVRSLNANKPMDRFITEQLAGDELAGAKQGDWTSEQIELLTATGFLTMAADGTGSGDNSPEARNKVIADTLKIIGSSLLGSSIGCAQCHDHRYDPISQRDYFAIRAVFEPAFDWQQWRTPEGRKLSLYTQKEIELAARVEEEAKQRASHRKLTEDRYMAEALQKELEKYEEPLRTSLKQAYETPSKDRNEEQTRLLKMYPSVNITPGVLYQYLPKAAEELKNIDQEIAAIRAKKPREEFIRVMTEIPNRIPDTHLFHRGDHQQPRQKITPRDLPVTAPEGEVPAIPERNDSLSTSGRRLAYARWLTNGRHPLVSRVLVNHMWVHHFGKGIVATPGEFGKLGTPPTHPELLDWLAYEFVRTEWDLKSLHRTILNSNTYKQSSRLRSNSDSAGDGSQDNWRKPLMRLDAEVLRDRMIIAAGNMQNELYGPPIPLKSDDTGQIIVQGKQTRKSLYLQVRRSQPVAMLQSFDAPVMDVNCDFRPVSTVATQSLILLNGEFALQQAEEMSNRVLREAPLHAPTGMERVPLAPSPKAARWSFGYSPIRDQDYSQQSFRSLDHWTGSEWQGGPQRPDPTIGWVILNQDGGHPGSHFAAVRRWTCQHDGILSMQGTLKHLSENGDGVRARLIHSRHGMIGEWSSKNQSVTTALASIQAQAGDIFDFVVDCKAQETSDSFQWPIQLVEATSKTFLADSRNEFHGPNESQSYQALPYQLLYAWQLAYARNPTDREWERSVDYASVQLEELERSPSSRITSMPPTQQVIMMFCHALFNSNEFVYVD